jgi:hypothetical protein
LPYCFAACCPSHPLNFFVPALFEPNQSVTRVLLRLDQLIDFGMQRLSIAVLGRLSPPAG